VLEMDEPEMNQIKNKIEDHEKRILELESLFAKKPDLIVKDISVKEFIIAKKPKDDVQKTLVLGYYLEKYRNMTSFNAKDLDGVFREAKESVPGNINDKAIKNIDRGFIMEAKEKKDKLKAWHLTNTGERIVENDLKD
jgi:hypothetical protein